MVGHNGGPLARIGGDARARVAAAVAVTTVAIAASALLAVGTRLALRSWADVLGTGPATLDDVVAATAATAALGVATWLAAASVLSALAAAWAGRRGGDPLGRWARAIAPQVIRSVIAALVGAAVATATAGPALAAGPSHPTPQVSAASSAATGPRTTAALDPGWTPSPLDRWPPASARAAGPVTAPADLPGPQPRANLEDEVVVRRGDTLWDIAARHLGPGAGVAEIAVEWPRWYVANRDRIGSDPDHIEPGQRLVPPPAHPVHIGGQR